MEEHIFGAMSASQSLPPLRAQGQEAISLAAAVDPDGVDVDCGQAS